MKLALKLFFAAIFLWMSVATVRASLQVSLWDAWSRFAADPWSMATLCDAYCGFLTFYVWVVYKERSWALRVLWFLLIMGLGNIATALYILVELFRLPAGQPAERILWRNR